MFLTSKDMLIDLPPDLGREGWQQWHTVSQLLPIRWFHIRYFTTDLSTEHILMTGDLDVVHSISSDASFNLINVSLVSPPQMNGSEEWVLSSLIGVVTMIIKNGEAERLLGYEYHLKTGIWIPEYIDRVACKKNQDIQRNEITFNYKLPPSNVVPFKVT